MANLAFEARRHHSGAKGRRSTRSGQERCHRIPPLKQLCHHLGQSFASRSQLQACNGEVCLLTQKHKLNPIGYCINLAMENVLNTELFTCIVVSCVKENFLDPTIIRDQSQLDKRVRQKINRPERAGSSSGRKASICHKRNGRIRQRRQCVHDKRIERACRST